MKFISIYFYYFCTAVPLPKDVRVTDIADDGVTVSWTIPEDEDLIGNIIIQYKVEGDTSWQNQTVVLPSSTAQLTGLDPDTEYSVRVVVESQDGQSSRATEPSTFQTIPGNAKIERVWNRVIIMDLFKYIFVKLTI